MTKIIVRYSPQFYLLNEDGGFPLRLVEEDSINRIDPGRVVRGEPMFAFRRKSGGYGFSPKPEGKLELVDNLDKAHVVLDEPKGEKCVPSVSE
jgi:hypothetical protein